MSHAWVQVKDWLMCWGISLWSEGSTCDAAVTKDHSDFKMAAYQSRVVVIIAMVCKVHGFLP